MIINVAISGSVQYQVGMQNAKCIVSINHNAASPIFDISHYGAVADFKAVLPSSQRSKTAGHNRHTLRSPHTPAAAAYHETILLKKYYYKRRLFK